MVVDESSMRHTPQTPKEPSSSKKWGPVFWAANQGATLVKSKSWKVRIGWTRVGNQEPGFSFQGWLLSVLLTAFRCDKRSSPYLYSWPISSWYQGLTTNEITVCTTTSCTNFIGQRNRKRKHGKQTTRLCKLYPNTWSSAWKVIQEWKVLLQQIQTTNYCHWIGWWCNVPLCTPGRWHLNLWCWCQCCTCMEQCSYVTLEGHQTLTKKDVVQHKEGQNAPSNLIVVYPYGQELQITTVHCHLFSKRGRRVCLLI